MDLNDTTNRVIALIMLSLLFIGGWWLIARNTVRSNIVTNHEVTVARTEASPSEEIHTDTTPSETSKGESITVVDQRAGSSVQVASVSLSHDRWIAVRDSRGFVLGALRLKAGISNDAVVDLLRATESGKTYHVLVYEDDGDAQFDLHSDTQVANAHGDAVGATFVAQ